MKNSIRKEYITRYQEVTVIADTTLVSANTYHVEIGVCLDGMIIQALLLKLNCGPEEIGRQVDNICNSYVEHQVYEEVLELFGDRFK